MNNDKWSILPSSDLNKSVYLVQSYLTLLVAEYNIAPENTKISTPYVATSLYRG